MNLVAGLVIFAGAGLGALLRWVSGHFLNPALPSLPLGTLAANLVGGLLMGVCLSVFAQYESLSPELRLALTTGFLGGLTTFSTFSGESITLLLRGEYRWACAHIVAHLAGSLLATLAGVYLVRSLMKSLGVLT